MRMMAKFHFPVSGGNELVRSGKLNTAFENLMGDLKPEAAYFFPDENGERAGLIFFDLAEPSMVVGVVERFAFGFGAQVMLTPVMNADDIQKGLGLIPDIVQRYG